MKLKSLLFVLLLLPLSVMADCWPVASPTNYILPISGQNDLITGKCIGTCFTIGGVSYPVNLGSNFSFSTDFKNPAVAFGVAYVNGSVVDITYSGDGACISNFPRFFYKKDGLKYNLTVTQAEHVKSFFNLSATSAPAYPVAKLDVMGTYTPQSPEMVITGIDVYDTDPYLLHINGYGFLTGTGTLQVTVNGVTQPSFIVSGIRIRVTPTMDRPWMNIAIKKGTSVIEYDLMRDMKK